MGVVTVVGVVTEIPEGVVLNKSGAVELFTALGATTVVGVVIREVGVVTAAVRVVVGVAGDTLVFFLSGATAVLLVDGGLSFIAAARFLLAASIMAITLPIVVWISEKGVSCC